jgi:arginyl-tRNA--protein-N-Asp/Glu arginylyltransferase
LSAQKASKIRRNTEAESNSSCSYAVYAQHMDPALYEQMICNGWRRSGNVIYLPNNELSCCPTYPIRLPVNSFIPSKSQRKVVKQAINLSTLSYPVRPASNAAARDFILPEDSCHDDLKTSRMTRRKLEHPASRSGHVKGDKPSKQNSKIFLDAFYQSRILKLLCQWTEWSVQDALRTMLLDGNMIEAIIHSLPVIQYKVKPTKRQLQSSSPTVTCISTICAAVVGKSGGLLHRGDFVNHVVLDLHKYHSTHRSQAVDSLDESKEIDTGVTIQSIDCHLNSGQILVSFMVDTTKLFATKTERVVLRNCESTSSSSTASSKRATNTYPSEDPIQSWWKSMPGTEIGRCSASHRSPVPPYEITITTRPAHESALDPQVHQLYWHYQHLVHGELDPRMNADNSSVLQTRISGNDIGNVSEGNDNASSDWGQHAPSGWREAAIEMLNNEYRKCPSGKLRKLVSAFGSFYEFLVENPFLNPSKSSDLGGSKNGLPLVTYHQHYALSGGLLIAVGVIDVLPCGLSSVYLFYNPSFADNILPMGKYSTMKEIEYAQEFLQVPYYYLGYYIHTCSKMNYKIDFRPSELLCHVTMQWVGADQATSIIEEQSPDHNYCSLVQKSLQNSGKDENGDDENASVKRIDHILLELGFNEPVPFGALNERDQKLVRPVLEEFLDFIGASVASQCTIDLRV